MADFSSVVVGAGLALVAQAFLQLIVVPRVEARTRREGRWENDVREVGELLSGEVVKAAMHARIEQARWISLHTWSSQPDVMVNRPNIAEELPRQLESARAASQQFYDLAVTRIGWLADEILHFDNQAEGLKTFWRVAARYEDAASMAHFVPWQDPPSGEEFARLWAEDWDRRKALTDAQRVLRGLTNPPRRSARRLVLGRSALVWRPITAAVRHLRKRTAGGADPSGPASDAADPLGHP